MGCYKMDYIPDRHAQLQTYCCKMSDLNDDLLNYDIGEDIDEQVLLAADEDDLLLSDEEIEEEKTVFKDEAETWANSRLKTPKTQEPGAVDDRKLEDVVVTTSSTCTGLPGSDDATTATVLESDVSTSEESPLKTNPTTNESLEKSPPPQASTTNDEVSSTNKDIEDQTVSQTVPEKADGSQAAGDGARDAASAPKNGQPSDPREDPEEERGERRNIKLSVERDDQLEGSLEKVQPGRFPPKRGRGGPPVRGGHFPGSRPPVRYPHLNYPHHPNENVNPQMAGVAGQYPGPYGHMDPQMGGARQPAPYAGNIPPPMDYNRPMAPNYRPMMPGFRPQNPNEFNMFRGARPDFMNGTQYNNFGPHGMRPLFRPNGAPQMHPHMRQRMPMQRQPTGVPPPGQGNFIPQQHAAMGPGGSQMGGGMPSGTGAGNSMMGAMAGHAPSGPGSSLMPRKVLINPNFKGGVEAATSQLMKDTQFIQAISSHVSHLQSDEELLRQQEEFINKNRIHIEKRRFERSPERNRSRERSYSPPRRGDRERRGDSRERRAGSRGRGRRGDSREPDARNLPKRRRSDSLERRKDKDPIEEEDEETRAYRLEIEKQKAMREKIWKDKEMRRRKAAEDKLNEDKPSTEEPPAKLKPIIVTESKIISLKRKTLQNEENERQHSHGSVTQKPKPIQRTIPTAKILPEAIKKLPSTGRGDRDALQSVSKSSSSGSATLAVIKPVMKKTTFKRPQLEINESAALLDEDALLEDELLADTPSPPLSPKSLSPIDPYPETSLRGGSAFITSNRRVVLKSSKEQSRGGGGVAPDSSNTSSSDASKKGIFDRLEKRKIMIKNAE